MLIWVDADACPVVAREILFRAADRTGVPLTLVANQPLGTPASKNINTLQVPRGFDVADDEIVKRLEAGDLVITSDIPLAAEVIEKGGHALHGFIRRPPIRDAFGRVIDEMAINFTPHHSVD